MYYRLFNIDYTIFRICVPYGNLFDNSFSYGTIGFFLSKAKNGLPIILYGDGKLKRTFTHVKDICMQIEKVVLTKRGKNDCLNVKGETLSLLEAAELIALKYNVTVELTEWPENAYKLESGDTVFDGTKITKLLKTTLQYTLKDWLEIEK